MEPAAQAVMIADTLLAQCVVAARRLADGVQSAIDKDGADLSIGEVERTYAGTWEHLDRARSLIGDVPAYDALRAQEGLHFRGILAVDHAEIVSVTDSRGAGFVYGVRVPRANLAGMQRAAFASHALKAATPHIDWGAAIHEAMKPAERIGSGVFTLRSMLIFGGIIGAIGIGTILWNRRPNDRAATIGVPATREPEQIAKLRERLAAKPCDGAAAQKLVTLYARKGAGDAADDFAEEFNVRCQRGDAATDAVQGDPDEPHQPVPLRTVTLDGNLAKLDAPFESTQLFPDGELVLLVVPFDLGPKGVRGALATAESHAVSIDSAAFCGTDAAGAAYELHLETAPLLAEYGLVAIVGDACPQQSAPILYRCTAGGCEVAKP